jgi:predicted nucleotidyltransferase
VFGIDAERATRDVDFAIALADWNEFESIKQTFIDSGNFQPGVGAVHRLYYRADQFGIAYPVDLIPFGEIESSGNTIAWPPDMAVVMNVIGYPEAMKSAVQVDVGTGLIVNVVSIPALTALKLLAWNDRGLLDNKDASDVFYLLRHYHEAGNSQRLYEEAFPVLAACGYDVGWAAPLCSARMSGLFSTKRPVERSWKS